MSMPRTLVAIAILMSNLPFAEPLSAADGRFEINQACAEVGCFPGDGAGFPIEITASGSYVLTGDLSQPVAGTSGMFIEADRVTLDLNGFSFVGPGSAIGIGIQVRGTQIDVRNGRILDFGAAISTQDAAEDGHQSRAKALTISKLSTSHGIRLGDDAVIEDCTVSGPGNGIFVGDRGLVVGNRVSLTGDATNGHGIGAGPYTIIRDNVVVNAGGFGIDASGASMIISNVVHGSGLSGIDAGSFGSVVVGNAATVNQNYGIEVGDNHLIRGNNAYNNNQSAGEFTNIEACATCTVVDNHAP